MRDIVTDLSKFNERVDEIYADTPYAKVKECVAELRDTMVKNPNIVSLCAPQLGYDLRMFMVRTADKTYKEFLNPMIVSSKGIHLSREKNESLKNKTYIIPRKNEIHLAYQKQDGHVESETFIGAYAEVIQQMTEMLDGILLCDYGLQIGTDFDKASKEDKEEIIEMYLDHLKEQSTSLRDEIEATPKLKQMNDTIEFMKGMILGDIKPIDADGNIVDYTKRKEVVKK